MIDIFHFKWDHSLYHRVMQKMRGIGGDKDYEFTHGEGFINEYRRVLEYIKEHDRLPLDNAELTGIPELHYERNSLHDQS